MARPNKTGLDYFPLDVDFFADEKMAAISGEFGIKGDIAVIKLLCAVYRNGYFILWNEPMKYKMLRDLPGISPKLLDQIINRLVKWGFFDESLFNSVKVLTSRGIQKRFFAITKRRNTGAKLPYVLVSACNNPVASELLHTITPQSKVNISSPYVEDIPPQSPETGKEAINSSFDFDKALSGKKEKVARKRKELNLSSVEPTFQPIVADWLAYKSERGQTYRQRGFESFYARLMELSGGNADTAREIIEQSKANNWSGIFPLKTTNDYGRNADNRVAHCDITSDELMRRCEERVRARLARTMAREMGTDGGGDA